MHHIRFSHVVRSAFALALIALSVRTASAQCENKTGFAKKLCEMKNTPPSGGDFPGMNKATNQGITTAFADTIHGEPLPPSFDPQSFRPMSVLERSDDGAFILKPGIYEAALQSFAIDAGDVNVTKPAGYYPAPIKGKRAKVLAALLKEAELHPDVPQADIQQLVFALVAGTDLEKMNPALQQTALRVLPKDTLKQLQGAAQATAFNKVLMDMINQHLAKDKNAQQTLGKINDIGAQMQKNADNAASMPDINSLPDPVARGAWAQMPGGFYVRYLPEGYTKTRLQLIVPDTIASADGKPLTFDPTQYLAVLGQVPSERLGITLRPAR